MNNNQSMMMRASRRADTKREWFLGIPNIMLEHFLSACSCRLHIAKLIHCCRKCRHKRHVRDVAFLENKFFLPLRNNSLSNLWSQDCYKSLKNLQIACRPQKTPHPFRILLFHFTKLFSSRQEMVLLTVPLGRLLSASEPLPRVLSRYCIICCVITEGSLV